MLGHARIAISDHQGGDNAENKACLDLKLLLHAEEAIAGKQEILS